MHEKHEYHVFHVDFERVEVPFIIALWIFVSSLAKIGKKLFLKKKGNQKIEENYNYSIIIIVVNLGKLQKKYFVLVARPLKPAPPRA